MGRRHSPTDDLRDLRAVFDQDTDLSAHERSVMGALILHRNGKSDQCDPSVNRLAAETGISKWSVIRAIRELETRGWVDCRRRHGARTTYHLKPGAQGNRLPPATGSTQLPVAHSTETGSTQQPERTKERANNTITSDSGESDPDPAGLLWPIYVEEMDASRMKLTKKRRKKLRMLWDEQLEDEDDPADVFRHALRAVQKSEWHMGNRDYQTVESLFGNEEKRERWMLKGHDLRDGGGSAAPTRRPGYMTPEEFREWDEGDAA